MGWKRALGVRVPSLRTLLLGRRKPRKRGEQALGCLLLLVVGGVVLAIIAAVMR